MRSHHNHAKTALICAFLCPETHPFLSALFLQWPSFCRHDWCQGGRMAACLWWETVAHVAGLAAKIWHYWLKKIKEGKGGRGGVQKGGPFKPCEIVVSGLPVIFTASPPLFPDTPSPPPPTHTNPTHINMADVNQLLLFHSGVTKMKIKTVQVRSWE